METANQAKRREGGTDRNGLRDEGMEWKSKTDLMFPCLVWHGTLAAPDPTPATFLSALHLLLAHMHSFVLPVQWLAVGFLHSELLITGSHVSCSHLFPPLPHLFIFPPFRYPPLNIWTDF